jgi:hypothetical protein
MPPKKAMTAGIPGIVKSFSIPTDKRITITNSSNECPVAIYGPAINPCLIDSRIFKTIKGPGEAAPDSPTKKDKKKIVTISLFVDKNSPSQDFNLK